MKMRGEPRVAMTFFGEGATANGQCHEALNFAGVHQLPVIFVVILGPSIIMVMKLD